MADFGDEASEVSAFHEKLALANHANRVNRARAGANLYKIQNGIDVECEECGEAIEPARIELVPDAEYCAHCAGVLEKKGKQYSR